MAGDQKFCPYCGASGALDADFCYSCGKKFPVPPLSQSSQTSSAEAHHGGATPPPLPRAANSDFITLSCPNCGGSLKITNDIERFACQFCGYEHIVRRSGGTVALEPVMRMIGQINDNINFVGSGIQRISGSTEKGASEAAIVRLKAEIVEINKKLDQADNLTRNIWMAVLVGAGVAIFGWIAGWAEQGVDYSMEQTFKTIGGIFTGLTLLIGIAAVSSSVSDGKKRKQQDELVRQKEAEISRHYQVVSQWK